MKSTFTSLLFAFWVLMLNINNLTAQSPITFTGDRVICNGSGTVITAHAENACIYIWSSGEVGSSIFATGALTHTVTVTDCNGNPSSASITIIDSKMISNLQLDLCKNSTASIMPVINEGYWTANNPSIATITREGMIMAVDTGKTTFSYHYYDSECVAETKPFEVLPLPEVASAKPSYCLEDVISLTPKQGGTWTSMDHQLASIKNNGEGKPLSPGNPKFIFTSSETGCSRKLDYIIIHPKPIVELAGNDSICSGFTTFLLPSSGGTWSTTNYMFASINNSGLVTGLQPGKTTFVYHQSVTGCSSDPSPVVTVIPTPKIVTDLPSILCIGGDKICLTAPGTVYWTSLNPAVASINNKGIISPNSSGDCQFVFSPVGISCASEPITFTFQNIKPSISTNTIKQNSFIYLSSDAPGTWTSLHENILGIAENKKAISYKAGTTKLEFMADEGCYASFGIKVKAGKAGSNADVNPDGFTNTQGDGTQFIAYESETRKTENQADSFFEINLYPNPTNDVVYIQSGQDWDQVQIHNPMGQLIWKSNGLVHQTNTSTWQPGIYMVSFMQGGNRVIKKLIKI